VAHTQHSKEISQGINQRAKINIDFDKKGSINRRSEAFSLDNNVIMDY